MASPVVHWEISGHEQPALVAFYSTLFGWDVDTRSPEYGLVTPEEGGVGGGIAQVQEGVPPAVTIYVQVEDLEAALGRAVELGAAVVRPPEAIPGVGRFALFRDPERNVIGLLGD